MKLYFVIQSKAREEELYRAYVMSFYESDNLAYLATQLSTKHEKVLTINHFTKSKCEELAKRWNDGFRDRWQLMPWNYSLIKAREELSANKEPIKI